MECGFGKRRKIGDQTLWIRRARHFATRDVLPTERLRFIARTQSDRSRSRIFCRPEQAEFHRARRLAAHKRKWARPEACSFPDGGKGSAAAASLYRLQQRPAHRRSNQRDAFAELALRYWHGIPARAAGKDRNENRK